MPISISTDRRPCSHGPVQSKVPDGFTIVAHHTSCYRTTESITHTHHIFQNHHASCIETHIMHGNIHYTPEQSVSCNEYATSKHTAVITTICKHELVDDGYICYAYHMTNVAYFRMFEVHDKHLLYHHMDSPSSGTHTSIGGG